MKLNDEQRRAVMEWVEAGITPSDVQKQLKELFGISLTYLDMRLLLDDLKLVLKDPVLPEEKVEKPTEAPLEDEESSESTGHFSLSVDRITRPNALISGKVLFSDGQKAEWSIDQTGRPMLNPETIGYRPSQEDIMKFQVELQRAVQGMGG